jgi:hypothetical protein
MLARSGAAAPRRARADRFVTLPRTIPAFDPMNQAMPDIEILFDGTVD